jgi:hypothetical protein
MPFYRVVVERTNLHIPVGADRPPLVGFFTTRVVWSSTLKDGESKALQSVRNLWSSGRYASQPSASLLSLAVSESGPSTLSAWLRATNHGHAFFPAEGANETLYLPPGRSQRSE